MAIRRETADFVDRAPLRAVAEREVGATPDRVFEVLADTPSWPEWFPSVTEATWLTAPPHGVGSRRVVQAGPLRVAEEFIAWDPGERWGFTFLGVNLPGVKAGVEMVELQPVGNARTRVRYTMALEPSGLLRPLAGPFRKGAERGVRDGLAGLDSYVTT